MPLILPSRSFQYHHQFSGFKHSRGQLFESNEPVFRRPLMEVEAERERGRVLSFAEVFSQKHVQLVSEFEF